MYIFKQWRERMEYEIKHDSVYDELVERGYLEHCTYEEDLKKLLKEEKVPFYIGFDATADSLTIGHFIQIMVMMRMQAHGHIPIALLGGGTTMIGDPSGRSDMRMVMTKEKLIITLKDSMNNSKDLSIFLMEKR